MNATLRLLFPLLALLAGAAGAREPADEELTPEERLFFSDEAWDISHGELEFLTAPQKEPQHHHWNRITLTAASLEDGWIELEQCHHDLDAVPDLVIEYGGKTRGIEITGMDNIGAARVEGNRIVLEDVGKASRLCLTAAMRTLERGEGGWLLTNGPYHRRFLDGYFPLHLTLEIHYPADLLRFDAIDPAPQPGFRVETTPGAVTVDTLFRGILETRLRFAPRAGGDDPG